YSHLLPVDCRHRVPWPRGRPAPRWRRSPPPPRDRPGRRTRSAAPAGSARFRGAPKGGAISPGAVPGRARLRSRQQAPRRRAWRAQGSDRLADRRRRHAEFVSCAAKAAVLGDGQERFHAVERALPDCEVLLHSPSTLTRIVARWKRSYITTETALDAPN